MEEIFSVVSLSRAQFALTTMFHILFPTLTIGLALYLVVVEILWLRKSDEMYYRIYRFWVKIFAINFGVGVVSGIVLEFEFGTNFSRFSQAVANVFSPLLAFEAIDRKGVRSERRPELLEELDRHTSRAVGDHGLWLEPGSSGRPLFGHLSGCGRGDSLRLLDHGRQFLDADPRGVQIGGGKVFRDGFLGRHLQPLVSDPVESHGDGLF